MFILLAGTLALMTAAALALPFFRGRQEAQSRAAYDAQTYRAQLAEIDQDVSRGVLTEAEAKAARIEVSRRLLAATDAMEADGVARTVSPALAKGIGIVAAMGIPALAAALYLSIGAAGRPDMPLETRTDFEAQMAQRPSQKEAERILDRAGFVPEPPVTEETERVAEMIAEVEAILDRKPDDRRGRLILARTEAQIGRYADAWRNYAILAENAEQPDMALYGEMLEAMVSAANGYVSPEAETVVDSGLSLSPGDPRFGHYKALAHAQRGESGRALIVWNALLENAEPDAPWVPMVYGHAERMAQSLDLAAPPLPEAAPAAGPGPTREQMAAAAEMSDDDRTAMIEGMVAGLAERLAEEPDDLQGWLRLIRAYAVLGRADDRAAALATARATFAEDAAALARIADAAR